MSNKIRSALTGLLFLVSLVTLTSAFNLPSRSPDSLSLPSSLRTLTKPSPHHTSLTFADRVAYQRAIEEVYWRHRIWPRERPDRKPSLDAVMLQSELERKVEDYLRNSQALEDYWQKRISTEELQAEMERMAKHTKQPGVLRELFAALGNDPSVIAECVARPVLTERLVADLLARDKTRRFESARTKGPRTMSMAAAFGNVTYRLPTISDPCADDTWTATSTSGAPSPTRAHTAVWTGTEMIVWGGLAENTGGRYDPSTDTWTATSTTNAPSGRQFHTAVWTGSEMIIWGGQNGGTFFNTGGRYNPSSDTWAATSTSNAPSGRYFHRAVWTGSEMIVWGGTDNSNHVNTGGRYNPGTDSWVATSTANAPDGRELHSAVWTGNEMIVWGGTDETGDLNTGGRYNPTTDSWMPTSTTSAPAGREFHSAVWTGSEMIAWGGFGGITNLNTGGRYNPATDSWTSTNTSNAPSAREAHTAVWTGNEMIVWGGVDFSTYFNTGGRYNPGTNSWRATSTANSPVARSLHTAVWTGSEMIVWGGQDDNLVPLNTGGRYCAQSAPMAQSAVSRKSHGAAGTFDINMPLTGSSGVECRSGGATHDYSLVVTFSGNVTVTGMPQSQVVTGTGCVGSGGTCDPNGTVTVSGNIVTVPLTNVADVQVINVQINGVNGASDEPAVNVNIPMGVLVGDVTGNRMVNASDVALTKSKVGQVVGSGNFREDVNASGTITATDVAIVKSDVGHSLPP
jgi:N-acetylneuraminic acid mutarotase